jgi:hypothetical protein
MMRAGARNVSRRRWRSGFIAIFVLLAARPSFQRCGQRNGNGQADAEA